MRSTKRYMSLPYNPALKERAKALRRAGNLSEVLLWNQIKKKQFLGLDFDRQKIIGNYIVDFYCAEKDVVIEVDGSSHDHKADYDAQRDAFLTGLGLFVIHLTDSEVKTNLSGVMEFLRNHAALSTTPPLRANDSSHFFLASVRKKWSKGGMKTTHPPSLTTEFSDVELKDKRLKKRLLTMVAAAEKSPGSSLPEQAGSDAALEGAYR